MLLELKDVSFSYDPSAKEPRYAVENVSISVSEGEFIALIGHTGSGKSTLIQFLNGLLSPTKGTVLYEGQNIAEKDFSKATLRSRVGLVFQYPEHQLFEMTILKDVMYGPKNQKLSKEEQEMRAKEALSLVGFCENDYEKSPFDLSGGEKRRVAIAGVLAMKPKCLVLDEPTAGLDPEGRDLLLDMLRRINREEGITVILVSHSMDDVSVYANRVIVMNHGRLVMDGPTREVFSRYLELEDIGLSAPDIIYTMAAIRKKGLDVPKIVLTKEEAKEEILKAVKARRDSLSICGKTPEGTGN